MEQHVLKHTRLQVIINTNSELKCVIMLSEIPQRYKVFQMC